MFRSSLKTPFGTMHTGVDADGVLFEVWLPNKSPSITPRDAFTPAAQAATFAVHKALDEYFLGKRRSFDVRMSPRGTDFEQSVWSQLRSIPYGAVTSYGTIAAALGLVNGARAVGRANGANPIPIIIPCHRVIGGDGTLTGFGGGLPLKRALLELEGAIAPPDPLLFQL